MDKYVKLLLTLIAIPVCIIVVLRIYNLLHPEPPTTITVVEKVPVTVEKLPDSTLMFITFEDLEADLAKNYAYVSSSQRKLILEAIQLTSKQYNINPLILYAICAVESSFRSWLVHDKVKVLDWRNKPTETHAIGLGGIIYEIWEPQLKEAHLLETRSDLYNPAVNIAAIGVVYSELRKLPLKDKSYHVDQSALIRYFGGNYQSYFKKIDDVIIQLLREKIYTKAK